MMDQRSFPISRAQRDLVAGEIDNATRMQAAAEAARQRTMAVLAAVLAGHGVTAWADVLALSDASAAEHSITVRVVPALQLVDAENECRIVPDVPAAAD